MWPRRYGSLTKFSRSCRQCAAGARWAAFPCLAESFRPGAARGSLAGSQNILRRTMARRRESGSRVHDRCLLLLPPLLWSPADGVHLRYLRVGPAIGPVTPCRTFHAGASGANHPGVSRGRPDEAPLRAGVASGHFEHRQKKATAADRTAGAGSGDDQRFDRHGSHAP